jgi:hypothetical protein
LRQITLIEKNNSKKTNSTRKPFVKSGTGSGSEIFRHFQTYRYIGPDQFIVNCGTSSLSEAVLTCTDIFLVIRIILHFYAIPYRINRHA